MWSFALPGCINVLCERKTAYLTRLTSTYCRQTNGVNSNTAVLTGAGRSQHVPTLPPPLSFPTNFYSPRPHSLSSLDFNVCKGTHHSSSRFFFCCFICVYSWFVVIRLLGFYACNPVRLYEQNNCWPLFFINHSLNW